MILIFDIGSQLAPNFQTRNKSVRTALDTRFYAYKILIDLCSLSLKCKYSKTDAYNFVGIYIAFEK